jgi:hypothetical protein
MKQEFINKVIEAVNNWTGNYEAKEENGLIIIYFEGKEVAFIKNYKADSETEGNDSEVEQLQYYCDTF